MDHRPSAAPTIAAVIPAYNAAGYVEDAIRSVLRQSRPPDEVVVVDDGSEDATADIAEAVAPDVRVVRAAHGGSSAARNAGAEHSRSTWIAYLDADDRWDEEKVEVFEGVVLANDPPGLIFSDFRRRDLELGVTREKTNTDIFRWLLDWPADVTELDDGLRLHSFSPERALGALLKGYPVFPSTVMVRRDVLERAGGWDPRFTRSQDLEVWMRMVRERGMAYLDRVLTTVHVREGHGEPYDWVARQLEWDLRVLKHHVSSRAFAGPERDLIRRHLGLRTVWRGDLARKHGRWSDAFRWYIRSLRYPRQIPRGMQRVGVTLAALAGAGIPASADKAARSDD